MVRINLYGAIFGTSGYASHTKQLFVALQEAGADVKLETGLIPGWEGQVSDAELLAIKKAHFNDGVSIMIGTPPFWASAQSEPCSKFYGFVVWEGNLIPKGWIEPILKADGVFVPSVHVRDAILATTGSSLDVSKLHLVPHGVDTALFVPTDTPHANFTFCVNKGWNQGVNDRGGVQFALQAFSEEFGVDEPVDLRVKINAAYCGPGWSFAEELKKLNLAPNRKSLYVSLDSVPYRSMPRIYDGCDVFVNPTMGEAFSIPCAEAMSCGLPVITTDSGGQLDFVNETNGWLVDSVPFEVVHDINYEGITWRKPLISSLRAVMRYVYDHRDEVRAKGLKARETIESYTWRHSAQALLAAIGKGE